MNAPIDESKGKDRRNIVIAIVIGSVAALYGMKVGVINPLDARITRLKRQSSEWERNLNANSGYLRETQALRTRQQAALIRLKDILEDTSFVIEPRFGNYELPAQEQILLWSDIAGIDPPAVRGARVQPRRWPGGRATPPALSVYTVSVALNAGLEDLSRFLRIVENENPFCAISRITIETDRVQPQSHRVSLVMEMPVWAGDNVPGDMRRTVENATRSLSSDTP